MKTTDELIVALFLARRARQAAKEQFVQAWVAACFVLSDPRAKSLRLIYRRRANLAGAALRVVLRRAKELAVDQQEGRQQ